MQERPITASSTLPRRSSLGRQVVNSTTLLLGVIGTLIVVLALLILFHNNANATKGYQLRKLEDVRRQSLLEQEVLNMEIAKAQALATLQSDHRIQSMVKPKKPTFVKLESGLAQNNN